MDPWSVAHFISGGLIVYVLLQLGFDFWTGLGINFILAIAWELFEKFTQLSATEYFTNNLTDILFAQFGFIALFYVFRAVSPSRGLTVAFVLFAAFLALVVIGWISYTYYRSA